VLFSITNSSTTETYTLSLHDALPIYDHHRKREQERERNRRRHDQGRPHVPEKDEQNQEDQQHPAGQDFEHRSDGALYKVGAVVRSEEHTSELQSRFDLVCRLLLEKKK